jgi:hypothetical protein
MKLRLALILAVLGLFGKSAQAQSSNCSSINWNLLSIARTYGPGNRYIASQTVTYTVTCTNNSSGSVYLNTTNAVTATGQGGFTGAGPYLVCNPAFSVAGSNAGSVPGENEFSNFGEN